MKTATTAKKTSDKITGDQEHDEASHKDQAGAHGANDQAQADHAGKEAGHAAKGASAQKGEQDAGSGSQKAKKVSNEDKKVQMVFAETKYYNDLEHPIFDANKVYEVQGAEWISRWQKRGGKIVEGKEASEFPKAKQKDGPSTVESAKEHDDKRLADKQQAQIKLNKDQGEGDASHNLKAPVDERKEKELAEKKKSKAAEGDKGQKTDETDSDEKIAHSDDAKSDAAKL